MIFYIRYFHNTNIQSIFEKCKFILYKKRRLVHKVTNLLSHEDKTKSDYIQKFVGMMRLELIRIYPLVFETSAFTISPHPQKDISILSVIL